MVYQGSKNKISKYILPILYKSLHDKDKYLEPFVGGCNIIDKIECDKKIGLDIHPQLIDLLIYCQNPENILPTTISNDEYEKVANNRDNYESWYVGLVGFCASFGGSFFNGYARTKDRDIPAERIRNLQKQRSKLKGVNFFCESFLQIPTTIKNFTIYCDPPYINTKKYSNDFNYELFYSWCRELSKNNNLFISEYTMPSDFKVVTTIKRKSMLSIDNYIDVEEKIFTL